MRPLSLRGKMLHMNKTHTLECSILKRESISGKRVILIINGELGVISGLGLPDKSYISLLVLIYDGNVLSKCNISEPEKWSSELSATQCLEKLIPRKSPKDVPKSNTFKVCKDNIFIKLMTELYLMLPNSLKRLSSLWSNSILSCH